MDRIVVSSLNKVYKSKSGAYKAVDALDFSVANHEILGLIGKNGAGKTSTVKMLAGIMMPTEGTIRIDGEDPFRRSRKYRKNVTLVMGQKGQMDIDISIWDNALYFLAVYGIRKKEGIGRIHSLAERLDVEGFLHQQVRTLSLGQKMKGEFLVAFLHEPSVIFLDEPTLGLDYATQKQLRLFLQKYKAGHEAVMVLTSHNMEDIETLSDRILVMDRGIKLFEGTIAKLRAHVRETRSVRFRYVGAEEKLCGEAVRTGEDEYVITYGLERERDILRGLSGDSDVRDMRIEPESLSEVMLDESPCRE